MKIGIVGMGNMGRAFAAGLLKTDKFEIAFVEKYPEAAERARREFGITVCPDIAALAAGSDVLLLAVKPQDIRVALEEIASSVSPGKGPGLISVAAGVSLRFLSEHSRIEKIARFMPNLAAAQGCSAVGMAYAVGADESFRQVCREIAAAVGKGFELPERLIPAVTGLSGSGIAYAFAFLHAMALGGTQAGIAYPVSLEMALLTLEGAVKTAREAGTIPPDHLVRVISPAGTTIEGLAVLESGGFTGLVMEAVCAAAERAVNLES